MLISAFLDYLLLEKNYAKLTVLAYKNDIETFKSFLQTTQGHSNLNNVCYPEIRQWIVALSNQKLTNRSINRKVSALNSFFKFLLKIEAIKANPLAKHRSLKTANSLQIPFSEEEITVLLDEVLVRDDFESARDYLIIELFYATGIRRAELINLQCKNIDYANRALKVVGKRNKERIIPLLPSVIESFKLYFTYRNNLNTIVDKDFIFLTKKGVKVYETLVYRMINSYFGKASSKKKKSPHIIRHSFATHMLNEGANLNTVKTLLGHSSLASTQVYTHQDIEKLKQSYKKAHPRSNL